MRLIDADELMEKFYDIEFNAKHELFGESRDLALEGLKHIKKALKGMPTIDPIKHGRWIQAGQPNENSETLYRCSICGYLEVVPLYDTNNYCGNCGARMDGGEK